MRWVVVVALLVGGCGAQMMSRPNTGMRNAPVNEGSRAGIVKYLADGAGFVVNQRRQDAYDQMARACGGRYRIIEERQVQEGSAAGGFGTTLPFNYIEIRYTCE